MVRRITASQLRDEDDEILDAVERGERFEVISAEGVPLAELVPLGSLVPTERLIAALRNAPSIDAEDFRRSVDEILDQDPTPRF